jgi:hypothetical protein
MKNMKTIRFKLILLITMVISFGGCYTILWSPEEQLPSGNYSSEDTENNDQIYYSEPFYGEYNYYYGHPWWVTRHQIYSPPIKDENIDKGNAVNTIRDNNTIRNNNGTRNTTDNNRPIINTGPPVKSSNNNDSSGSVSKTNSSSNNSGEKSRSTEGSRSNNDNSARNNDGSRNSGNGRK